MSSEPPDDGAPIFTKRQLIQSLGQAAMSFAGTMMTLLIADTPLNWKSVGTAALAAFLVAGGVLGFSFAGPGKK